MTIIPRPCLAQLSRLFISPNARVRLVPFPQGFQPQFLAPYATAKNPSARGQNPQKNKKKGEASKKKRKPKTAYTQYDLKDAEQFSLCDAMRYAFCRLRLLKNI
jgi:large subunit ribosomal protein L1